MRPLLLTLLALVSAALVSAQSNPVPLVYQPLIPTSVAPRDSAFVLNVQGFGFVPGAVVQWNGQAVRTRFVSSSMLEAKIPAGAAIKPGTAAITVSNPGTGAASNVIYFTVRQPSARVNVKQDRMFTAGSGEAVVGDFNGDNILDIAVPTSAGTVDVYLGKGGGSFAPPIHNPSTPTPGPLLVGDFNGDGKLDIAVSGAPSGCPYGETTSVMLGNGDGTLTLTSGAICGVAQAAADLNADGKLDLIIAGTNGETASTDVYLGNGDGTFNPNGLVIFANIISLDAPIAMGDFNDDGKLDLAFGNFDFNGSVGVFLGNGDGTFQNPVLHATQFGGTAAVAADVDGDGSLDIVTSGVSVLRGHGNGTFTEDGGVSVSSQSNYLAVADVNGDGKLDLWVSSGSTGSDLLLGNGNGTFQNPSLQLTQGTAPLWIGDFNRDGKLDLLSIDLFLQR